MVEALISFFKVEETLRGKSLKSYNLVFLERSFISIKVEVTHRSCTFSLTKSPGENRPRSADSASQKCSTEH